MHQSPSALCTSGSATGEFGRTTTFPEVYRHATKALELDPLTAEAHAVARHVLRLVQVRLGAWSGGLVSAVELNPSAPMVRLYWSMHLAVVGRIDESLAERDAACQLDPSAMAVRGNASWVLYLARRMDAGAQRRAAVSACSIPTRRTERSRTVSSARRLDLRTRRLPRFEMPFASRGADRCIR